MRQKGEKDSIDLIDIFLKKAQMADIVMMMDIKDVVLGDPYEAQKFCNQDTDESSAQAETEQEDEVNADDEQDLSTVNENAKQKFF